MFSFYASAGSRSLLSNRTAADALRVLIVDDDEIDRGFIRRSLTEANSAIEVVELDRGESVTETLRMFKPALTLLDLKMPGMSGFDTLRAIRAEADLADHQIYILSTSDDPKDKAEARALRASAYHVKPRTRHEYRALAEEIFSGLA